MNNQRLVHLPHERFSQVKQIIDNEEGNPSAYTGGQRVTPISRADSSSRKSASFTETDYSRVILRLYKGDSKVLYSQEPGWCLIFGEKPSEFEGRLTKLALMEIA